jgi:hypothetical protein
MFGNIGGNIGAAAGIYTHSGSKPNPIQFD